MKLTRSIIIVLILQSVFFILLDEVISDSLFADLFVALLFVIVLKVVFFFLDFNIFFRKESLFFITIFFLFIFWNQFMREFMIKVSDYDNINYMTPYQRINVKYLKMPAEKKKVDHINLKWNHWAKPDPACKSTILTEEKTTYSRGIFSTDRTYRIDYPIEVCIYRKYKKMAFISRHKGLDNRYYKVYSPKFKSRIMKMIHQIDPHDNDYILFDKVNTENENFSMTIQFILCAVIYFLAYISVISFTDD